jgi:hypothetical protein
MRSEVRRIAERAPGGAWLVALVCGVVLRTGEFGGVEQHAGNLLLGAAGLSFALLLFLLMDERPIDEEAAAAANTAAATSRCERRRRTAARGAARVQDYPFDA